MLDTTLMAMHLLTLIHSTNENIYERDVQRTNVENNVDKSSLWAP